MQIGIFPKGLVHELGQKVEIFFIFCVCQKSIQKKCLLTFYIKKKPLKTIKTSVYEKRKIKIFPKLEISSTLIFMQNKPRKTI